MTRLARQAGMNLQFLREKKPLIHNITNYVVMNYTANALLCAGASPVMAHADAEVEEMVTFAGALVLNIGTLSDDWISSMIRAGRQAGKLNIPIILDPVGSGATQLRTRSAQKILDEVPVRVLRGNASEILSLGKAFVQSPNKSFCKIKCSITPAAEGGGGAAKKQPRRRDRIQRSPRWPYGFMELGYNRCRERSRRMGQ